MPAPDRRQRAGRGASATSVLGPHPAARSETSPAAVGGSVKARKFLVCESSLKLMPFESLDAVSYSPSIVTMAVSVAVCEIFRVKEWCDLENGVTVRSRSLELAPFDRSHTSSYSPSIVTIWRYLVSFARYNAKFLYPAYI